MTNDTRVALTDRAAHLLECYAEWIHKNVMATDLEAHPYLPEIEGVAEDLRALRTGDGLTVWTLVEKYADAVSLYNEAVRIDVGIDKAGKECLAIEKQLRTALSATRQPGEVVAGVLHPMSVKVEQAGLPYVSGTYWKPEQLAGSIVEGPVQGVAGVDYPGGTPFRYPAASAQQDERKVLSDADIREVFMAYGFTIKDGQTDLKPYVFAAARALLSRAAQVQADAGDAARYRWLKAQYLAADFDWQGESVLVFKFPRDAAVSADCDDTIRAAMSREQSGGEPK